MNDYPNIYPPVGYGTPKPGHPLLCASCGVVFGLSSSVANEEIVTCHHCQCQNRVFLSGPGSTGSKPITKAVEGKSAG